MTIPGIKTTTLNKLILFLIGGLELLVVEVMFWNISPMLGEKIAMLAIGAVIVVFKIRARITGRNVLWFVGALLSFIATFSFFLTIVSIGLPTKSELTTAKNVVAGKSTNVQRLELEYNNATALLNKLLEKGGAADENNRTYATESLPKQILAARSTVNEARAVLGNAEANEKAQAADEAHKSQESFNGMAIFGVIPVLLEASAKGACSPVALILAMVFGVALGIFIEGTMITAAKDMETVTTPVVITEVVHEKRPEHDIGLASYLNDAWVIDTTLVLPASAVASNGTRSIETCLKYEQTLFKDFQLMPIRNKYKLIPEITRAEFVRRYLDA